MENKIDQNIHINIVVKVESGIPVDVFAFKNAKDATAFEKRLRKHMNPEKDETGVFQIQVL